MLEAAASHPTSVRPRSQICAGQPRLASRLEFGNWRPLWWSCVTALKLAFKMWAVLSGKEPGESVWTEEASGPTGSDVKIIYG